MAGRVGDVTALTESLESAHVLCSAPGKVAPMRRLDRSQSYPIQPPSLTAVATRQLPCEARQRSYHHLFQSILSVWTGLDWQPLLAASEQVSELSAGPPICATLCAASVVQRALPCQERAKTSQSRSISA